MKVTRQKLGTVVAAIMLAATLTACAVARDPGPNGATATAPAMDAYSHDVYFY